MANYSFIMNSYKCYHQLICHLCCQIHQVNFRYTYFGNDQQIICSIHSSLSYVKYASEYTFICKKLK